ncbi:hypothetical protein LCGC14_1260940 [marine sediment metagenome]|uniref:Uncharacterized protein n=1 Tax=marine sediment metagenome TaxID=412755 RepID=A0A0F9LM29_9ZZZZ
MLCGFNKTVLFLIQVLDYDSITIMFIIRMKIC